MTSSLTFLGAARTVTGSRYLVEAAGTRVLVDCGMFQGLKELRLRNWADPPVPPASIESVVLTHAHLDHVGMLPRLVAQGFNGRIFCTPGTQDLCSLVLPDAGRIQEEEAERANRYGYSKHKPAKPLFTEEDAIKTLSRLQPVGYERPIPVANGALEVEFIPTGHLLGAAYVLMHRQDGEGGTVLFGGDLGRYDRPVLVDPSDGVKTDVLLVESTYGDRLHPEADETERLKTFILETAQRKGKLIIPSFSIGRVEEVLYAIKQLEDARQVPPLPVYVDSPMALKALEFYKRRAHELDDDIQKRRDEVCAFCTARFTPVPTARESQDVVERPGPAIVIASSGMATGGRVLHHLANDLPDPKNTVLFVGFQAAGTRGRQLIEGASEVKIRGQLIPVQARIEKLNGMSAHADAGEILRWLKTFPTPPGITYLVHGEPSAQDALKIRIENELAWNVQIPRHGDRVPVPL
ncbi:MAG: MBL fold metallo-hydrolase [Acidobacteria bacterium]|nr:MBL fold metallo-hydrolase [Acidobacteriota bacterium]